MIQLNLNVCGMANADLRAGIKARLAVLPEDSIVKLKIHGTVSQQAMDVLSAPALRVLAPSTMNINGEFVEVRRPPAQKKEADKIMTAFSDRLSKRGISTGELQRRDFN
jgi:hypothetical protein